MPYPRSNALAPGIAAIASAEGCNTTRYTGVVVYRVSVSEEPTPTLYAASLILVGAGEKHGTLGEETFVYDAAHYLVVTAPLPMVCRTLASVASPVFTLVVGIELDMLRELLLEIDPTPAPRASTAPRTVFRAPLTPSLETAGVHLLQHLADERRPRSLARNTIREMLFHVLEGPYGDSLRALAHGPNSQLGQVLRHMSARYTEQVRIEELARLAHMSVPTFHQRFKAMTAITPLQYIKAIRLTNARQMLHAGGAVKTVAHDVGYASESQFSREYRRFFGAPPSASFAREA